ARAGRGTARPPVAAQVLEGRVRVAAVEALDIPRADPALPRLHVRVRDLVERPARNLVPTLRRVVPHHLVCGDVIGAGDAVATERRSRTAAAITNAPHASAATAVFVTLNLFEGRQLM